MTLTEITEHFLICHLYGSIFVKLRQLILLGNGYGGLVGKKNSDCTVGLNAFLKAFFSQESQHYLHK